MELARRWEMSPWDLDKDWWKEKNLTKKTKNYCYYWHKRELESKANTNFRDHFEWVAIFGHICPAWGILYNLLSARFLGFIG